jgi:hypothetical protein
MEIALRSGERLSRPVALAEPSERRLIAKFHANTAHLPAPAIAALEGAVLHEKPPVRALVQLAVDGLARRQNTRP